MKIEDSTFLVTGGSAGLGAGCVRRLAGEGANVVIADIQEESGIALAEELGETVRFVQTDVTSEEEMQAAVDVAVESFMSLQGLVNCAGIHHPGTVLGRRGVYPLEQFCQVIAVNLIGTFNATRLAVVAMAQAEPNEGGERGVIVCTASVAAFEGQIGQTSYSASKAGVVGMTLPLARELARYGIRVMTIAPGIFDTDMLARLPENVRESLGKQVPFPPRLGTSDEFAALVQQIIEHPLLNGEVIRLDGALRMGPR